MTCTSGRKQALCAQPPGNRALTGIDFVWVNPDDHREIRIFFVVPPDDLDRLVDESKTEFIAKVTGLEDSSNIPVISHEWDPPAVSGLSQLTLCIATEVEGDFQTYRLNLVDTPSDAGPSRLDPFCNGIDFSFKQPCPSPFDCKPCHECPEEPLIDYPVDYLARDFESFRAALLAYSEDRYPQWDAKVPADFGGMMSELFAALGDEFSYIQDRFQREGHLTTLTQPRSFDALARLVDYKRDPGQAASGLVVMRKTGALLANVPAGARVWAAQEDRRPVPFEVGQTVEQMAKGDPTWPVHPHWADIPAYLPDTKAPCLPVGAREMILAHDGLLRAPFPAAVIASEIGRFWNGKQLLIETRPTDPDAPVRRQLVTLDKPAVVLTDPLMGAGPLVRIHWRKADALPFELDLSAAFVSANLVPVRAGMSVKDYFIAGEPVHRILDSVKRTVERAGPVRNGARPTLHRFTLASTAAHGLGWQTLTDDAGAVSYTPDAVVTRMELKPAVNPNEEVLDPENDLRRADDYDWRVIADPLASGPHDEILSIEAGRFETVFASERNGVPIRHRDYADGRGWTLRFGGGVFGRSPVAGDVYRAIYRTGPGAVGNVPADTILQTLTPPDMPAPLQPLPNSIVDVRNPMPLTDGRDPEPLERARRVAPAAYKALTFRAVRDTDYRDQVQRLDWIERARAVTRWTGAWPTTFVTADPKGAYQIDETRMATMQARLSAVRQTGRAVLSRQPVYQALDLKIAICVDEAASFGHVAEAVIKTLAPRKKGFFSDRNFSFGDPLRRPALEAAIAAVEGVRAVREIEIRQRGRTDYELFLDPFIPIAADRVLKVENDPQRPGHGSIRVYDTEIPHPEEVSA